MLRRISFAPVYLAPFLLLACTPVKRYDRGYLADPTMQRSVDPLSAAAQRKLLVSREGAAGGDAKAAGGGCSCGN